MTGVPTGYYDLDDLTAGLQASDLIVIAGRPSMGKTSLALGMAQHAALHAGAIVGIFSLEMSKPQLVLRMLSSEARVDSHALRTGKLQKEDWWRLEYSSQYQCLWVLRMLRMALTMFSRLTRHADPVTTISVSSTPSA